MRSPLQVTVVKTGSAGLKGRKGWSTGNTLFLPSGVPIQRPGVRSLRSTLTNLPLIVAPAKEVKRCDVTGRSHVPYAM